MLLHNTGWMEGSLSEKGGKTRGKESLKILGGQEGDKERRSDPPGLAAATLRTGERRVDLAAGTNSLVGRRIH